MPALLALPPEARDELWLQALEEAGRDAWKAKDARNARAAFEAVLEGRSRMLSEDDLMLAAARANVALAAKALGDLRAARPLEELVLAAREKALPPDHPDVQVARLTLASTLSRLGDLPRAKALDEQVVAVRERTLPPDHPDLQSARGNLSVVLLNMGDLDGALALQQGVLEVWLRTLPPDDLRIATARQQLAETLSQRGDLRGALALLEQVLPVLRRALPPEHPNLQMVIMSTGVVLWKLGDFEAARPRLEGVHAIWVRTLPDDHPDLQKLRVSLAVCRKRLGDLRGARELEERVLAVYTRVLPPTHPDLQRARANSALTLVGLGELERARELLEGVLAVYEASFPEDHRDLQATRVNLADVRRRMGDLEGARALQEQVLAVFERTLPPDSLDLQSVRLNLAAVLREQGDLPAARAIDEQALEILEKPLPADSPSLRLARQNLALVLEAMGDRAGARALLEDVVASYARSEFPADHAEVQLAKLNLATVLKPDDPAAARRILEEVLAVREQTLGPDDYDLQVARGDLALTLQDLGETARARELLEDVLASFGRTRIATHPDLQIARQNVAWTLALAGEAERARALGTELGRCALRSNLDMAACASPREAEQHAMASGGQSSFVLSMARAYRATTDGPKLAELAFELVESARGAGLRNAMLTHAAEDDPALAGLRRRALETSARITVLGRAGAAQDEVSRARTELDQILKEIAEHSREGGSSLAVLDAPDSSRLRAGLEADAALIGYWSVQWFAFPGLDLDRTADEGNLVAFVLRPERPLAIVDLGPRASIEAAVESWRAGTDADAGRGSPVATPSKTSSRATGEALRTLVFDPLRDALEGARRLVVAPDDVLHAVALDALPDGNALLGDRWRIEVRTTLWECALAPRRAQTRGGLLAVGGVDYDREQPAGGAGTIVAAATVPPRARRDALRDSGWETGFTPLPATRTEAEELARLFALPESGGSVATLLEGAAASRRAFLDRAPEARFLHVATHGWFSPAPKRAPGSTSGSFAGHLWTGQAREEVVRQLTPMSLCGLALAGANEDHAPSAGGGGLVSAEEIATLDLAGCELAVLSACDTNVGVRRAGQGVASLQKALHMAGARSVITSLWKVPDEATRELMLDFYRRIWIERKPKAQALWEAKTKLRDAKDEHGRPLYAMRDWAAWVLTGDPR